MQIYSIFLKVTCILLVFLVGIAYFCNMKRKAIVMGASSGLGREVAIRLLREGWTVAVAARRMDALQTIQVQGKSAPIAACIDVTSENAASEMRSLIEKIGGVDLYFHVSGIGKKNMQLDPTIELNTVQTNAVGFTRMVGEVFRWMASHDGGHIAVISSVAGTRGLALVPSYSATKAFQNNYIQALERLSYARKLNIKFTDIRPGFVDTDLIRGSHFPMTMTIDEVVDEMMAAVSHGMHVRVIDWKWRIAVAIWRLTPQFIWRRLQLIK